MFGRGGPGRRERHGQFALRLSEPEQLLIKSLLSQLRTLLRLEGDEVEPDSTVRRLFPTAYPDDQQLGAHSQRLVHDDLLRHRLRALDLVEETVVLPRLDEEQLTTWLKVLNDL